MITHAMFESVVAIIIQSKSSDNVLWACMFW